MNSITIQEQKLDPDSSPMPMEPTDQGEEESKYKIPRGNFNSAAAVAARLKNIQNFTAAK